MAQPAKPTAKDPASTAPAQADKPLPDAALEKVSGGSLNFANVSVSEITVTKTTDKSTPILGG